MNKYDKIRQVEEIESIINQFLFTFGIRGVANALYENGYRKPTEDELIINVEEYQDLVKKATKQKNK